MQSDTRKRIWLYSIFVLCAFAIIFGVILPRQRLDTQAARSAAILRTRLSADQRFAAVRVRRSTNGSVVVSGEVRSESELDALKHLVEDAQPPRRPILLVRVLPNPK